MNVSLYQAAAALNANDRWQELNSQNIASSSIPGFKKQELSFDAVQSGVLGSASGGMDTPGLFPHATATTSFQPGELKSTGVKTDLAIEGRGFFEVQLPNGDRAFTRDGEFQLNAQGQFVTKQGNLVIGETGPIQIDINNPSPVAIALSGEVSQGHDVKGKIKIADFNDTQLLSQIGGGLFKSKEPRTKRNRNQRCEGASGLCGRLQHIVCC